MNLAVIAGVLSRDPQERVLPSGDELISFDVSVVGEDDRKEVVPVSFVVTGDKVPQLKHDQEVVVFGRVRKRFFQSAVGLQSRTEVIADRVLTSRNKRSLNKLVENTIGKLEELDAA